MKGYSSRKLSLLAPLLAALSYFLLMTGCATNNKEVMMHQPTNLGLDRFKTATVEIRSSISRDYDDLDQYQLRLETQIISALRKDHAFEKIYTAGDTPSELQIIVTITDLGSSHNYDHFRIGYLAGEGVAQGTLQFRENATGKLLASCPLETNAFGNTEILGNTEKATDHMVTQIVDLISRNLASDGSKETAKLQSE